MKRNETKLAGSHRTSITSSWVDALTYGWHGEGGPERYPSSRRHQYFPLVVQMVLVPQRNTRWPSLFNKPECTRGTVTQETHLPCESQWWLTGIRGGTFTTPRIFDEHKKLHLNNILSINVSNAHESHLIFVLIPNTNISSSNFDMVSCLQW